MKHFRVSYFYLATGMEGHADRRDFGVVDAPDAHTACRTVATRESHADAGYTRQEAIDWMMSCLSAEEVR